MHATRNLLAGAVAGAVGTAAMDLAIYLRYRREGGEDPLWEWETAAGVSGWDAAPAPGQVGRRVLRGLGRGEPPDRWARTATNVVHWATGVGWGIQYGAVASRTPAHPGLRAAALGPVAWLSSYVLLPLIDVYEPIWAYDLRTLARDLSGHLVYGAATSATFAALATPPRPRRP